MDIGKLLLFGGTIWIFLFGLICRLRVRACQGAGEIDTICDWSRIIPRQHVVENHIEPLESDFHVAAIDWGSNLRSAPALQKVGPVAVIHEKSVAHSTHPTKGYPTFVARSLYKLQPLHEVST